MIDWGIDHGLDGLGPMENMSERLGPYLEAYIDGYKMGFIMRKAGRVSRDPATKEQDYKEYELRELMTLPRYQGWWRTHRSKMEDALIDDLFDWDGS